MRYLVIVIIISVVWIGFVLWTNLNNKKQDNDKKGERPPFRSEKDLEEYGKPMEDEDYNPIDLDDAE